MNVRERIESHDETAIIDALSGKWSAMDAVFALNEACKLRLDSIEVKDAILSLEGVEFNAFAGVPFSSLVNAACDILGFRDYPGNDSITLSYIKQGFIY